MNTLKVRVYRIYAMQKSGQQEPPASEHIHFRKSCLFAGMPVPGHDFLIFCDGKSEKLRVSRVELYDMSQGEGADQIKAYTETQSIPWEDPEQMRQSLLDDRWVFAGIGEEPFV